MMDQRSRISGSDYRLRTVIVWDLPTRLFKWSLVAAVFAAFLVSSRRPTGITFLIHVACGYAVTLLLVFRIFWGFIGGEHARFQSFVRGWTSVRAYGQELLHFDPPRTEGHNPVGGWMIITLLSSLSVIVLTGLLAEGKTGGAGRLSTLLSADWAGVIGNIHAWLGFIIMWLAGAHVAGVLVESLLHGENLVLTMITGRKRTFAAKQSDARQVSIWRAVALLMVVGIIGAWLIAGTHLPPTSLASIAAGH